MEEVDEKPLRRGMESECTDVTKKWRKARRERNSRKEAHIINLREKKSLFTADR